MGELKILKDLKAAMTCGTERAILESVLREEAIKWIKEDREIEINRKKAIYHHLTKEERWMKRLNITEENLK